MDAKELRELLEKGRLLQSAGVTSNMPIPIEDLESLLGTADRLAAVEYRLQCANLYGHQCDADISELIKRAEKAEADLAALRARVEAAPVGETECCDAKGAWLVMADDAKLENGQRVRLLSDPQPEGR